MAKLGGDQNIGRCAAAAIAADPELEEGIGAADLEDAEPEVVVEEGIAAGRCLKPPLLPATVAPDPPTETPAPAAAAF